MSENTELDLSEFGDANMGTGREFYKRWKLRTPNPKEDETETVFVARLLPAIKSLKATGQYKVYAGTHFGYYGVNKNSPDKPRMRTFKCIEESKGKGKDRKITKHCPECDLIYEKQEALKALVKSLEAKDMSEEDIADHVKVKALNGWLRQHNVDRKFAINAMSKAGEFGILQLSWKTVMEQLEPCIEKCRKERKVDPLSPVKGVWLRFTRRGKRPSVTDGVEPETELKTIDGEEVAKMCLSSMTQEQVNKALKICPDLATEVVRTVTEAQIKALTTCDGSPEAVDAALGFKEEEEVVEGTGDTGTKSESSLEDAAAGAKTETKAEKHESKKEEKPEPKPEPKKAAEPEVDDEEAAAMALIAKKRAAREATAKEEAAKAAKAAAPKGDSDVDNLLDRFAD